MIPMWSQAYRLRWTICPVSQAVVVHPVLRLHSDKAKEFLAASVRKLLRSHGITPDNKFRI